MENKLAPVLSLKTIGIIRKNLHSVILAGGVFDIIHGGHVHHLKKTKSLASILIVHITNDIRVKEKKGNMRPLRNEKERALVIAALRFVNFVFIDYGRHYDQKIIDVVKPDVLFFNKEAFTKGVKKSVKNLKNFEGKIVVSKLKKTKSSSLLFNKLLSLENSEN